MTTGEQRLTGGVNAALESAARDVRLAFRALRRNPAYTAVAVLTLALGIGANTAVFSVVNGVLLKPLPYPEPDRLVALFQTAPDGAIQLPWSVPNLRDLKRDTRSLSSLVGYRWRDLTLAGFGEPRLTRAVAVSGSILGVLGVRPALGRDIIGDETLPGGPAKVLVSHSFWRERLGGDSSAVGRTLDLSGIAYEIVGVAPPGFEYPQGSEIWVPGQWSESGFPRGRLTLHAVGRLAPGVTMETARAELSVIAARLAGEYPDDNAEMGANVLSLGSHAVASVRLGLLVLLGAVAMVLLIACLNVANLVLVRGTRRIGEMAVRAALGASRAALLRQMVTESLVLSVAGAVSGVLLAAWAVHLLRALAGGRIPRMQDVAVDGGVLAFAAGLAVAVALLFGLAPALRLSRVSASSVIREGREGGGVVAGGVSPRARFSLVAAEVALSLVLLVGAGLLMRSFAEIRRVDLGFAPERVRQFTLTLPDARYDAERATLFFDALQERLAAIPGIAAAGVTSGGPLGSSHSSRQVQIVGEPEPRPGEEPLWLVRWVGPGYLRTLGIPLLRGRDLSPTDRGNSPRVALISQLAADRFFPGKDPIGQGFRFDPAGAAWTVVGVVGDVRSLDVTQAAQPEVYVPYAQWGRTSMTVVLRTQGDVPNLATAIRRQVHALDPALAVYDERTLDAAVASSTSSERFYLVLLASFAGLALFLAGVGLYGVVAYVVSGRTREIGIRMALGAGPAGVARMVAVQGMRPVLVGVVIGVCGALAGARVLSGLLYQIEPWDPAAFVGSTVLLVAVGALACVLPAGAASRTSPLEAIRAE